MPLKRTSSTGASLADALGRGSKSSSAAAAAGHRAAQKSAVFAGAAKTATAAAAAAGGKREGSNALSAAPERRAGTPTQACAYTKEQLAEAEGRPPLDADAAQYDTLWRQVQVLMGMPKHQPIHSDGMSRIDHILRAFDLNPSFGPCLGMSRHERWQRAEKLGDEPPIEIKEILETREGVLDLRFSVLHDKGV